MTETTFAVQDLPVQSPDIQPSDMMSEAGRKLLGFQLGIMLHNEPATRRGDDIEALHDMRVATRRMRAALRLFGPFYAEETRAWLVDGLRGIGRALGPVRDLDVLLAHTKAYTDDLAAGDPPDAMQSLLRHWQVLREDRRAEMLAYLNRSEYRDFVIAFADFTDSPGRGRAEPAPEALVAAQVAQVVPRLVLRRYEPILAFTEYSSDASLEVLHALRIRVKRLRYTLEFFSGVLGAEAAKIIEELVTAQDHLGALQDARVASSLVHEFVTQTETQIADGVAGYLGARERQMAELRRTFPAVWQGLASPTMRHKLINVISALW